MFFTVESFNFAIFFVTICYNSGPMQRQRFTVILVGVVLAGGLAAFYAIHSSRQTMQVESHSNAPKQTCMEVSIYDPVPFQVGGPSESQIGSAPGEVAWFGYPYWMIIAQAREKIRDLGPEWPIMNHRLLIAFMTREDAEEFVKVASPTAITCGKMTLRSDTYDTALIVSSYKKRQWNRGAQNKSFSR